MADWLEKGSEARMNTPGNPAGNWQWRVAAKDLTPALARKIHEMSTDEKSSKKCKVIF